MIGGDINGGDIIGGKKFILNWHSYDPFVTSTRGQKMTYPFLVARSLAG